MRYRRLGRSGLQVSEVVLGSWLTFGSSVDDAVTGAMRRVALNAALALATRDALGDENFAQLYGPFEELIPLADHDLADLAPWDALGDSGAVARAS